MKNREIINLYHIQELMKIFPEIDRSSELYDEELDKLFMKFLKKYMLSKQR